MIAYIKGEITYKCPTYVLLESGGIGYQLNISLHTYSQIQDATSCKLFTHLNVKSEGQSVSAFELYGFADEFEKEVFEKLISVSGIGANTGRVMLSSLSPEEVQQAILSEDVGLIQSIKGIGPKTAKRLILELKDKLLKIEGVQNISVPAHTNLKEEALYALVSLGIARSVAEKNVHKVLKTNDKISSVEDLIKETLKTM